MFGTGEIAAGMLFCSGVYASDGYWWIGRDSDKSHVNAYRLGKCALWKTQATLVIKEYLEGWPDCSLNISAGGTERAEGINLIRLCSVTNKGETMTGSSNKTNPTENEAWIQIVSKLTAITTC